MKTTTFVLVLACAATLCPAAPPADDAWIAALEGGWHGEDNTTPMGAMQFAMIFERDDDGSVHARTAYNRETWIDLRFRKAADGRWLLDESASMEGLGIQHYVLEPVDAPDDIRRWVWSDNPGFLTIDVALADERMHMDVRLRGEEHARYDLGRVSDDALPALKRELAEAARLSPAERSIHRFVDDRDTPAAVRDARAAVAADPTDARAHLRLGMAIGAVIQADPAVAPRHAAEMLRALRTAVDLDPSMPDTYPWLVGYYLNAPPIAGGSLDEAERFARKLAELDPQAGAEQLALVERTKHGLSDAR